jgi:hypothetical protein
MNSLNPLSHLAHAYPASSVALGHNNDQPRNERAHQTDTAIAGINSSDLDDTAHLIDEPTTSSPHEHLSSPQSDVDAANVPCIMDGIADSTNPEDGHIVDHGAPTQPLTSDPYDADDEGDDSDEEEDFDDDGPAPRCDRRANRTDTRPEHTHMDLLQAFLDAPLPAILRNLPLSDEDSATSSSIATLRAWFDLPSSTESEFSDIDGDENGEEEDDLTHFTDGSGYDEDSGGSGYDEEIGGSSFEDEDDGELAAIIALVESELDSLLPEEFEELMGLDTDGDVGEDTEGERRFEWR